MICEGKNTRQLSRYKLKWHVLLGNLSIVNCNSSIREKKPLIIGELLILTYIIKFNIVIVIPFVTGKPLQ